MMSLGIKNHETLRVGCHQNQNWRMQPPYQLNTIKQISEIVKISLQCCGCKKLTGRHV